MISSDSQAHGIKHLIVENIHVIHDCHVITENHRNNFYGETLSYGESFHTLGLSYRYKRLNIGMMTLNPFVDNYRMGGEMFSKVAPSKNWWYVKESCRLFVAKVSWNISFGRKYETMQKRVNNENSNAGTLKSGK